jgi:hypothetical protein
MSKSAATSGTGSGGGSFGTGVPGAGVCVCVWVCAWKCILGVLLPQRHSSAGVKPTFYSNPLASRSVDRC